MAEDWCPLNQLSLSFDMGTTWKMCSSEGLEYTKYVLHKAGGADLY